MLYLIVDDRLSQGVGVVGVVGTLMADMAVEVALRGRGIAFVRAKVGDRYLLEELLARGWQVGGEGSGHLLALDKHSTGDGILSALLVLRAVCRIGRSLAELLDGVALFRQTMINAPLRAGTDWRANAGIAGAQAQFARELGTTAGC